MLHFDASKCFANVISLTLSKVNAWCSCAYLMDLEGGVFFPLCLAINIILQMHFNYT